MSSLAEEFPREQARVRQVLQQYLAIGPAGTFGATMIERSLRRADQAAASGDVIEMLRSYAELQDIK